MTRLRSASLFAGIAVVVLGTAADARVVLPREGRFLSPDRAGMIDGPNQYVYALSNPVKYTDPMGTTVSLPPPPPAGWRLSQPGYPPDALAGPMEQGRLYLAVQEVLSDFLFGYPLYLRVHFSPADVRFEANNWIGHMGLTTYTPPLVEECPVIVRSALIKVNFPRIDRVNREHQLGSPWADSEIVFHEMTHVDLYGTLVGGPGPVAQSPESLGAFGREQWVLEQGNKYRAWMFFREWTADEMARMARLAR